MSILSYHPPIHSPRSHANASNSTKPYQIPQLDMAPPFLRVRVGEGAVCTLRPLIKV